MPDFLASVLVFSVVLSLFLFSWNSVTAPETDGSQIQRNAHYTSTFLVSTPGYPENWTSDNVQIPGLAVRDNVVSSRKLRRFSEIPQQRRRRLLGARNYFINMSFDRLPIAFDKLEYGTPPPEDASAVAVVSRDVVLEMPDYPDSLLFPENPDPNEQMAFRANFTFEEGSDTISNSLNSVKIDVDGQPDMFTGLNFSNVTYAGVDTAPRDGKIDVDLLADKDEIIVSNGGGSIKIEFSGGYTASAGDSFLIRIEGVDSPSGDRSVDADTSGDPNTQFDLFRTGDFEYDTVSTKGEVTYIQWR